MKKYMNFSSKGTEDSTDKKANKANKGTHKYGYDSLNHMTSSNIAGTTTIYIYDTLENLVLEKTKNKVVDYQYNELNRLTKKKRAIVIPMTSGATVQRLALFTSQTQRTAYQNVPVLFL